MKIEHALDTLRDLWLALDESVKLQSHYAGLLNNYDGGARMQFKDGLAWTDRLVDIGKLQARRWRPLSEAQIIHIFVEVANGRDNRGDFLRSFAAAIQRADPENLSLLTPIANEIVEKYQLEKYLDNYVAANFP